MLACPEAPLREPSPVPAGSQPRVVSLVPRAEARGVEVATWSLDRDTRRTLLLAPGTELVLPDLRLGPSCTLRLGLGVRPADWNRSGRVQLRVAARRAGEEVVLHEAQLDPRRRPAARWLDRTIDLTALPRGAWALGMQVAAETGGGRQAPAEVGIGTPWVRCRDGAPAGPPRRPHVLLVSLDTLRADHLGTYGHPGATSPAIDRFAAGATVFENAFATAPWTLPSHASMFTGLYPDAHGGGHGAPFEPLPADGPPTLAERLGRAGYRTVAYTAAGVVSRAQGLARGFEDWTELPRVDFRSVMPEVLDAVGRARRSDPEQPLFLFLHTYDIHGPYEVPPDHRPPPRPSPPRSAEERARWAREQARSHHRYLALGQYDGVDGVMAAYDAGIRFVDAQLGLFFDVLEGTGVLDDALVVLTSDHGEAFLEHGVYIGHSYTLYDAELRVPLIVRTPGQVGGARSAELVDLTDLVPLVHAVTGLPLPEGLPGSDPLARAAGRRPPRASVRAEAAHSGASAIRSRTWKLVSEAFAFDDPRMRVSDELAGRFPRGPLAFDVASDPQEERDRAAGPLPAEARRLRDRLDALPRPGLRSAEFSLEEAGHLDDGFVEQLRALGYLDTDAGTGADAAPRERTEGPTGSRARERATPGERP